MSNKFKFTLYTLQQLSDKEKMQRLWKILDIPIISPKFYGAVERAKIPFDSNAVETAAELYESEGFLFVRGEKDSFLGVFSKQSKGLSTWNIWLNIKAMQGNKKERWLEWLFHLCSEFPVLYGKGCSVAEYEAKHDDVKLLPNGGRIWGAVGVSIAEFYQYLPGLYWLNIFGAELVKAFGESTLMTLPDVEARSLNSHQIAICLLESVLPESMEQRLQSERRLADILGAQFFFDRNRTDLKFRPVPQLNEALEYSSSNGASRTEETIGQEFPSKIELEEDFENQVVLAFDSTPSYYLWHPSLESQGMVISVLLSRASQQRAPELGREFFEGLLARCGVSAGLTAWGVHDFISAYFQASVDPFAAVKWEECWKAILLIDRVVKKTELQELIASPFELMPEKEFDPHTRLPLRVIANFSSKKQAEQCIAELRKHALASNDWTSGVYGYEVRQRVGRKRQLWVDVTYVDRSCVTTFLTKAQEVMSICEQTGGSIFAPYPGK